MVISDFARPGDKIDITYLHQNNGKIYKSSVFDFLGETTLEIGMPTEGGKMILFQVGFECSLFFYTQRGMYICDGKVLDRYKKDGFYMMSVKITSAPKKYQRRDYYRVAASVKFSYYKISKEVADLETTADLFEEITDPKYLTEKRNVISLDISGGGIRFLADEKLENGSYILTVIRLANDKVDQTFYLVTEIIETFKMDKAPDKMVTRAKFRFKDIKDRDLIVRYVFEEDRMLRKKENGD